MGNNLLIETVEVPGVFGWLEKIWVSGEIFCVWLLGKSGFLGKKFRCLVSDLNSVCSMNSNTGTVAFEKKIQIRKKNFRSALIPCKLSRVYFFFNFSDFLTFLFLCRDIYISYPMLQNKIHA